MEEIPDSARELRSPENPFHRINPLRSCASERMMNSPNLNTPGYWNDVYPGEFESARPV